MSDTLTLAQLIDALAAVDPDKPVVFDDRRIVGSLASWRGIYSQLTLTDGFVQRTVAELLADARAADGAEFSGYKGGEYTMRLTTPVWADPWGEYNERRIVSVDERPVAVIVTTAAADEEPEPLDTTTTSPAPDGGCWVAYYGDRSGVAVFGSEIDALRYAVDKAMSVRFTTWGEVEFK